MPIEVFTGLPGHGKTSLMVERLLAEAKKAGRPIYAHGIDGLKPGIAAEFDPKRWHEPGHVEDGALLFVDEAWKNFGHLHDASRAPTPPHVLALAEHRHRGLDFVFTTQTPAQIYPFARGMIESHHHVLRRFGTQMIDVFTWQELNEDIKSGAKRDAALRKTRALPGKEVHDAYVSATVHTIKRRIPWRVAMIPIGVLGGIALLAFAVMKLRPDAMKEHLTGKKPDAAQAAPAGTIDGDLTAKPKKPLTAYEYAQQLLPRFATMPESAPAYDDVKNASIPQFFCMSSEAGETATGYEAGDVVCLTEQGTVYDLPTSEARRVARYGRPYNAKRQPQQDTRAMGQQFAPPGQMRTLAGGPPVRVNGATTDDLVTPQGGFGRELVPHPAEEAHF